MGNPVTGWMMNYPQIPIRLLSEIENNFIKNGESEVVMKRLGTQVYINS
jgi:hypothetical protein